LELRSRMAYSSSNDACVAVAEHLSGSVAAFTQRMTARAREIGATDTNFVTPNGLYHAQHYSTARDLAIMTRFAFQYPLFNEACGSRSHVLARSKNQKDLLVTNHNKFLSRYPGADGVKTGYVRQAGRCLVASATHAEQGKPWRLVAVVLNSSDTYGDSERMMRWGQQNFEPVFFALRGEKVGLTQVSFGTTGQVPLVAERDLLAIVRRGSGKNVEKEIRYSGLWAPVRQDQVAGKLVGLIDGRAVAEVSLVTAEPVRQTWAAAAAPWTVLPLFVFGMVLGPRYGRAFTKSARRRRRRLATRRRGADHLGESYS